MKLYATTTSERASKGQGGNNELIIDILGENMEGIPTRTNLFKLSLTVENDRLHAELLDYTEGETILLYPRHASTPPTHIEKVLLTEGFTPEKLTANDGSSFIGWSKGKRQKGE